VNYKAIVLLFSVTCAHAMEIGIASTLRNRQGNKDIFFKESIIQNNGYFDTLPLEVQGKIIKTILNLVLDKNQDSKKHSNQKIVQDFGLGIPILLGVKFCNEFYQMQKICAWEIGGKKFLAQELFVLPRQEKEVFIRMAHYPMLASGNIRFDDYVIIEKMSQNDIKKGLRLKVNLIDEKLDYINNASYISFIVGMAGQLFLQPFFSFIPSFFCLTCMAGGGCLSLFAQTAIIVNHNDCIDEVTWTLKTVKKKQL